MDVPTTTSEQPLETPEDRPAPERPAAPGPLAQTRTRARFVLAALIALAAFPSLAGLIGLLSDRGDPYLPYGDQAVLEMSVRDVGHHEVLLGAYSRFGWYHPGPLAAYLLAAPYRLLGGAHQALAAGTLVVAGVSLVCSVLLIRRNAGNLAALWALLVVLVSIRLLGAAFLLDSWNPYLPILPFLLGVLLCWTAIRGAAWALPAAVLPMSLAVQAHVGYLPPVAATVVVLAVGLAVRHLSSRRSRGDAAAEPKHKPRRWLLATVASAVLAVLLWLPPLIQQLTAPTGNAGTILNYLRKSSPDASLSIGLRGVADEFGKLPGYVAGVEPPDRVLLPASWPPLAIAIGCALFALALVVGIRRRRSDVSWLGAFTMAIAAAGVAAIARIDGLPFFYVTRWTTVIGMLAAITVGVAFLPEVVGLIRRERARTAGRAPRRAGFVPAIPLALLTTAVSIVTGVGVARADTPQTDYTGGIERLEDAVVADLRRAGLPGDAIVRVDFAATTRPVIVGTSFAGSGLVLALVEDGVDVQLPSFWRLPFGERYVERVDAARYVATLAYSDGSSPPPEPWQRVLAVAGEYQVYGGEPPRS